MANRVKFLLKNIIAQECAWKTIILTQWESIIGNLKSNVRIEAIFDDQLLLGVSHPALAQELLFLSPLIKQKINALIKQDRIKKISFRVVSKNQLTYQNPVSTSNYENVLKKNACSVYSLTIQQYNALALFKDAELKATFEKFFIRCLQQGDHNERKKS